MLAAYVLSTPRLLAATEYVSVSIEGTTTFGGNEAAGWLTGYSQASVGGIVAYSGIITTNSGLVTFGGSGTMPVNEEVTYTHVGLCINANESIRLFHPPCYTLKVYRDGDWDTLASDGSGGSYLPVSAGCPDASELTFPLQLFAERPIYFETSACCGSDAERTENNIPQLQADGASTARAWVLGVTNLTWGFKGNSRGCSIEAKGDKSWAIITAGEQDGTVTVTATDPGGCIYEGVIELVCAVKDPTSGGGDPGGGGAGSPFNMGGVAAGGSGCDGPGCNAFGAGSGGLNGGLQFAWSLGIDEARDGAGLLRLTIERPTTQTPHPRTLVPPHGRNGVEIIHDPAGDLRQVRSPQGLADLVTISGGYEIRFYLAADVGAMNMLTGVYTTGGSPYSVWRVINPGGDTNKIDIIEDPTSSPKSSRFAWITAQSRWELSDSATSRKILSWEAQQSGTLTNRVWEVRSASDALIYRLTKTYGYNAALQRRVITNIVEGDGTASLTTAYAYYPSTGAGNNTNKLQQITRSDGSWEIFQYDHLQRVTNHFMAWGNQGPTTNGTLCKVIEYAFESVFGDDNDSVYPLTARREIVRVKGQEFSRTYRKYTSLSSPSRLQLEEQICPTPGAAWNATGNLKTATIWGEGGINHRRTLETLQADRTRTYYSYSDSPSGLIVTITSGETNVSAQVTNGRQTVETWGAAGELLSRIEKPIIGGSLWNQISAENNIYTDDLRRSYKSISLDGQTNTFEYACCGLSSTTDKDGVVMTYFYDEWRRPLETFDVTHSLRFQNAYDPAGRITAVRRIAGTSTNTLEQTAFDVAGRWTNRLDALQLPTRRSMDLSTGRRIVTTTNPDNSTRIETFYKDGRLEELGGTSVLPARFVYGVEADGSTQREFMLQVRLLGTSTNEWTKTYFDGAGRPYKKVFPGGAYEELVFNDKGQLEKRRDADSVWTLFAYDVEGQLITTAIDANANGTIERGTSGSVDRIRDAIPSFTTYSGLNVRKTDEWMLNAFGSAASNRVATSGASVNGLRQWQTLYRDASTPVVVSSNITAYPSLGTRTETSIAPDGSYSVATYSYGRLADVSTYTSAGGLTGRRSFEYDGHGRQVKSTDQRNGTTIFGYDNADRIISVTTPSPGTGMGAQVTSTFFDSMGRATNVVHPDSGIVLNEFYPTGLLKKTTGARTFPVEYAYDGQGRMTNMITWRTYGDGNTAASTSWRYDLTRGWLTNKLYGTSAGPGYTYTPGGRLKTRTWARTISGGSLTVMTNIYGFDDGVATNHYPDVVEVGYNDGVTPRITLDYDRRGRPMTMTSVLGAMTNTVMDRFYTDSGHLLSEAYRSGILNGFNVTNTYDTALRKLSMAARNGTSVLGSTVTYGYDNASRLQTVGDGTYSATYGYLANSPLWQTLTFKQTTTTRATTTRGFDYLNRLQSISTAPSGAGSLFFAYQYNSANQRISRTDPDGSYWVYQYDALGQVTSGKRYWSDGTPVAGQQFEYGFDDIGNRKSTKQGGSESLWTPLRSATYSPNALNQYTSRTVPAAVDVIGVANTAATLTVNGGSSYRRGDYFWKELAVTNGSGPVITPASVVSSLTGSSSTNAGSFLTPPATQTFAYDADGNLTNDLAWQYTWDGENRLLSVENLSTLPNPSREKVSWTYDPLGRRITQTVCTNWNGTAYTSTNTIKLLLDGWRCVAELNSANSLLRTYAWGLDLSGTLDGAGGVGGLLWMKPNGGAAHFAAYDGNGNVVALVDGSSGSVSARYEFDPFGGTLRITGAGTIAKDNPFRFSTKRTEDNCELVLFESRAYSPNGGRWISRDWIGEGGALNIYGFVQNNPLSYYDYLGREGYWSDVAATAQGIGQGALSVGKDVGYFAGDMLLGFVVVVTPDCCCNSLLTKLDELGYQGSSLTAGAGGEYGGLKTGGRVFIAPVIAAVGVPVNAYKSVQAALEGDLGSAGNLMGQSLAVGGLLAAPLAKGPGGTGGYGGIGTPGEAVYNLSPNLFRELPPATRLNIIRRASKRCESSLIQDMGAEAVSQFQIYPRLPSGQLATWWYTADGVCTRGGLQIREFKASATAPLTGNQTVALPLIEQYGGAVRSMKGADLNLPQGTVLPPVRVQIIRQNQFQPSELVLPALVNGNSQ